MPPYLVERSLAGASIFDLVPPPGVTTLKAGDSVEAEIVRFYVPKPATNYYGPNAHFLGESLLFEAQKTGTEPRHEFTHVLGVARVSETGPQVLRVAPAEADAELCQLRQ